MSNDLNFLKQYSRVCAVLTMALVFSLQFKTNKDDPKIRVCLHSLDLNTFNDN